MPQGAANPEHSIQIDAGRVSRPRQDQHTTGAELTTLAPRFAAMRPSETVNDLDPELPADNVLSSG